MKPDQNTTSEKRKEYLIFGVVISSSCICNQNPKSIYEKNLWFMTSSRDSTSTKVSLMLKLDTES